MTTISGEDLERLGFTAFDSPDPLSVARDLVAAVDEGLMADDGDNGHALSLAAELYERSGELEVALALARRALAVERANLEHGDTFEQAYLGEMLLRTGREAEGMDELAALRPRMATESMAGVIVAEALEDSGRAETALEWLSEALVVAIERGATLDEDDDESVRTAEVIYDLVAVRHRIREGLGLGHDEYDQLFHELDQSLAQQDPPDALLFWPQPAFEQLVAVWPAVAETWEPSWDAHRLGVERALQQWSELGATDVELLVGSVDGLLAYAQSEQLSLADADDLDEAEQGYLDAVTEDPQAVRQPWPPRRNDTCWCGSGEKYKKCCWIRSRT
jgi:tetratricopeptide (TPR) repeat protein